MKCKVQSLALALMAAALGSAANADARLANTEATRAVTAPLPGGAHTTYYIVMNKKGRKIRGSNGTSVLPQQTAGTNIALFPVDVTNCMYVATLGRATTDGGIDETAGFATVVRSAGFNNGVFVQTFGLRGKLRNRPVHLLVAC